MNPVLYVVWRMCCFRWAVREYFDQGSLPSAFLFLRVDCECNRPSIFATAFYRAYAFNGNLNQWDVAKVTCMIESKSICIVENDWTWRELMLLVDWRVPSGGRSWWWWCDVKVVKRWCWRIREIIGCTPMAHCNNVWGLWVRVIFLWDVLMVFYGFCPLWDLVMRFDAFLSYSH